MIYRLLGIKGRELKSKDLINTNWSWNDSIKPGPLGNGIYFYSDGQFSNSLDESYIKQLSDPDYRYTFKIIKAEILSNEHMRQMDLTDDAMNLELEDIKKELIDMSKHIHELSNVCSDVNKLTVMAMGLFRKRIPSCCSIKKRIDFINCVKTTRLQNKLITHICVLNDACIQKTSIEIIEKKEESV